MLGALTLAMGTLGPRATRPSSSSSPSSVAAGAGLALDNARLFAEQARGRAGAAAHAAARGAARDPGRASSPRATAPSGRSNDVGGDFYDVFDAGGGEWAFVIGDVVGKGAEAAAITALVRATLQAAVLRGDGPHAALRAGRRGAAAAPARSQFCSAVHGRMRAGAGGGRRDRLLVAGHPPPLVLRGGGALEEVAATGTLLGVAPEPVVRRGASSALAPGDALLLYTDGATELRGGDPWRGEQALRDTVRARRGRRWRELVERVEREALVLSGGELRDDLAAAGDRGVRRDEQ